MHLQIPPGMPAVITVSSLMVVTLIFQGFIEGMWGCISCNLAANPPPLPLSCADVHVDSSGHVLIAVAGPHLGNSIAIYEINLDLFASSVTSHLKSRVELGIPNVGPIFPSLLLSPLRTVPVICHVVFDSVCDGLALLVISAGLGIKSSVRLERWEFKNTAIHREKLFPASMSPSLRNQHVINLWVNTASEELEAPQSPLLHVHGSSQLNSSFVTTFRCTAMGMAWLGYLGGTVESRDCKTLKRLHQETADSNASIFKELSETITTFANIPPIVISTGVSPNCASICLAYYSGQLCAVSGVQNSEDRDSYCRKLADMLELSMVRGVDPWDVFALLQKGGSELCQLTVLNVGRDMLSLTEAQRHFFIHKWESIRSWVYTLAGNNIASLDCQARSFMLFVYDTIRSTLTHTLPVSLSTKSFDEAMAHTGQPTAHELSALLALVPFAEWIVDLSLLVLRCMALFTKIRSQDLTEQHPFTVPEGNILTLPFSHFCLGYSGGNPSLYFPFYAKHLGGPLSQIPFVSFLFDSTTLQTLLELVILGGVVLAKATAQAQTQANRPKYDLSETKRVHGLVLSVVNCVASTTAEATRFQQSIQVFKDSLESILASTTQQELTQLEHDTRLLDLDLGQGAKTTTSVVDVLTRQPLHDKQHRKCLRCNRASSLVKSASVPWRERWSTACPICGGKWSVP